MCKAEAAFHVSFNVLGPHRASGQYMSKTMILVLMSLVTHAGHDVLTKVFIIFSQTLSFLKMHTKFLWSLMSINRFSALMIFFFCASEGSSVMCVSRCDGGSCVLFLTRLTHTDDSLSSLVCTMTVLNLSCMNVGGVQGGAEGSTVKKKTLTVQMSLHYTSLFRCCGVVSAPEDV